MGVDIPWVQGKHPWSVPKAMSEHVSSHSISPGSGARISPGSGARVSPGSGTRYLPRVVWLVQTWNSHSGADVGCHLLP